MDFDGDEYENTFYNLPVRTERVPMIGDGYFRVHRNMTNEEPKNRDKIYTITKYNFYNDSIHTCPYCFEHFKKNDNICISLCYHYWCETCHKNLKSNKCGFCKQNISNNYFIDSLGEIGFFEKSSHSLDMIQIIKDDINLIQIDADDYDDYDYDNEKCIDNNDFCNINSLD